VSYCRWSTDDFRCDLYVYEGNWAYTAHVADRRYVYTEPLPPAPDLTPPFTEDKMAAWMDRYEAAKTIRDRTPLVPIGLSFDGQTLNRDSPGEMADLLVELAAQGYRFPCEVIVELREEQLELDAADQDPRLDAAGPADPASACPHGPDQPCTCEGCWACGGHVVVVGCTCDVDWDELAERRVR